MESLYDHSYCRTQLDTDASSTTPETHTAPTVLLKKWKGRGYGHCKCGYEYKNSKKPKLCPSCGGELGGRYTGNMEYSNINQQERVPIPKSVTIYNTIETGCLRSIASSNSHDREFLFSMNGKNSCHVNKCKLVKATFIASKKQFICEHVSLKTTPAFYSILNFRQEEIASFTPDEIKQKEMMDLNNHELGHPIVVKVSERVYAVKAFNSTGTPLNYAHVKLTFDKSSTGQHKSRLNCMVNTCRKKVGKTKQGHQRKFCTHLHLVALARKLKERIDDKLLHNEDSNIKNIFSTEETPSTKSPEVSTILKNTMLIQKTRKIPLDIPPEILSESLKLRPEECNEFIPEENNCPLCGNILSQPMNQKGIESGYLITDTISFLKVKIKIKKCENVECSATVVLFPYKQGLFNISNKVLVSLKMMVEWREFLKDGTPVTNFITRKLKAIQLNLPIGSRLKATELDYLIKIIYNGYYAFEAMTERNLSDAVCGICGIAGKVYFGDGNEKNCTSIREINLDDELESIHKSASNDRQENMLETLTHHFLEKAIFAGHVPSFDLNLSDISPLISPLMRSNEFNTEAEKRSYYLDNTKDKIEGDAMMLSKLLRDTEMTIDSIEKMNLTELSKLAKSCDIKLYKNSSKKSQDMLKLNLRQLYATILVGKSACHQFVKSPGHTGGFYHIVCPHGTTVASKFMVLTESVRDAADLYLSLKFPPVMFVCDTPCTLVQHINNRAPEHAKNYWGDFDGCFEVPNVETEPKKMLSAPTIVPAEFQDEEQVPSVSCDGLLEQNKEQATLVAIKFQHPLTHDSRRFVCGDRFHTKTNPHKSKLCEFHNIDLCLQSTSIKTSYQESLNNKKNNKRNRSACTQNLVHHIFYNYLMDFHDNLEIVQQQQEILSKYGALERDELMRFVFKN